MEEPCGDVGRGWGPGSVLQQSAQRISRAYACVASVNVLYFFFGVERPAFAEQKEKSKPKSTGKPSIGAPFTLTDSSGKAVSRDDFKGHWVLLYVLFILRKVKFQKKLVNRNQRKVLWLHVLP